MKKKEHPLPRCDRRRFLALLCSLSSFSPHGPKLFRSALDPLADHLLLKLLKLLKLLNLLELLKLLKLWKLCKLWKLWKLW